MINLLKKQEFCSFAVFYKKRFHEICNIIGFCVVVFIVTVAIASTLFFSDLLVYPFILWSSFIRRNIVRKNLVGSFPEKSQEEIIRIEKKFYHFFCDYMVETIKLFSMSKKQIMRRMTFSGVEEYEADLEKNNVNFWL